VTVTDGQKTAVAPEVTVRVDASATGIDAETLAGKLRCEDPRVFVGPDRLHESTFTVNPMCLTADEADYVVERVPAYCE